MKVSTLFILIGLITSCSSTFSVEEKMMEIEKSGGFKDFDDSSPVFSGNVSVKKLFFEQPESQLTGAIVRFSKNARSAWHTHPKGQRLVVTKGSGLVQQWGKRARVIKEGDVIWTPPGVKHWHGASNHSTIEHWAIQGKKGDSNVDWLEKVTDDQYKKANHKAK